LKYRESRSSVVVDTPMIGSEQIILSPLSGSKGIVGDTDVSSASDFKPDGYLFWIALASNDPGKILAIVSDVNLTESPGVLAAGSPQVAAKDLTRGLNRWVAFGFNNPGDYEQVAGLASDCARQELAVVGHRAPDGLCEFRPDFGKHLFGHLMCSAGDIEVTPDGSDWAADTYARLASSPLANAFDEHSQLTSAAQQWCCDNADADHLLGTVFGLDVAEMPSDPRFYRRVARAIADGAEAPYIVNEFSELIKGDPSERWEQRHIILDRWAKYRRGQTAQHLHTWHRAAQQQ